MECGKGGERRVGGMECGEGRKVGRGGWEGWSVGRCRGAENGRRVMRHGKGVSMCCRELSLSTL